MTDMQTRPFEPALHTNGHGNGNGHTNGNENGHRPQPGPRIPPHSLDAERSLLGAMLLSRDAIYAAMEVCTAESFYKPAHGHIFEAILRLANAGEPVDPVTVSDQLRSAGLLDSVGGLPALTGLVAETPATSNAARYAKTITEHHQIRLLISIAGEIAEAGYQATTDAPALIDWAEGLIFALGDGAGTLGTVAERLGDAMTGWLDVLTDRYENGPTGVPTGVVDLDETLAGGIRPGEVCYIAARPAMGKSQIGVQVGYHVASALCLPCLIISAEMPTPDLIDRIVAGQARVDLQRIRTGRLNETDWPKVSAAVGRMADVPLWVYASADITLAAIHAQMRRVAAQARQPLGLVVVDYLQLLATAEKADNRQLEVDRLARGLKKMAMDAGVPILALCQVNRNVESRADKRPLLADLRESGGIEAHGDIVIALYRDEVYNTDSADRGTAELIVLKQRNGPLKTVSVAYLAQYGLFANMARV